MGTRITPDELAMYAGAMCSQQEIAEILGVTQQAVSKMLKKPEYREAWERARSTTKYKLRKAQIDNALSGKTVDLIWVGKQYLDQRDAVKEMEVKTDVQVTYIARWGGQPGGELPAAEDVALIEGEVESEEE